MIVNEQKFNFFLDVQKKKKALRTQKSFCLYRLYLLKLTILEIKTEKLKVINLFKNDKSLMLNNTFYEK